MIETATLNENARHQGVLLQGKAITRSGRERLLLDDVSLSISSGERIALVGSSGSGKTLLLRSLAMLDPLDGGSVLWMGKPVSRNSVPGFRSQVMYFHQRPVLSEGTIEDNLRHPFSLLVHQDKSYSRARVLQLLQSFGRDESFLRKEQLELSGGESQLIALIRGLQLDPVILLLDEPTAALDEETTARFETVVKAWFDEKPEQRAIVWVTHDRKQSQRVATRVAQMSDGKLVTFGSSDG